MAIATQWGTQMTALVNNAGGAIQTLPPVTLVGGRQRTFVETVNLAGQANGTVIGVARIPLYAVFLGITLVSSVSLGTATISFGDANNATVFAPAATLTVTTPTLVGAAAAIGQQISVGYDSDTGNQVTPFMPQKIGEGGALYEDIVMTVGAAALPGSGVLVVMTDFAID